MAHLPFKEDLRTYQFPTFSSDKRPEVAPNEEQLSAARRLVQNMNLSQGALLVHWVSVALTRSFGAQPKSCSLTKQRLHAAPRLRGLEPAHEL